MYKRQGICCFDSILAIVFRLMPVADASSFWVMPRSALASTSLHVIVSVMVFMSISISVFIYMHLQIKNCSGLFRYNNTTPLEQAKITAPNASFILSAGDQIDYAGTDSSDGKNVRESEYAEMCIRDRSLSIWESTILEMHGDILIF